MRAIRLTAMCWDPIGSLARFVPQRLPRQKPPAAGERDHRTCLRLAAFSRPTESGLAGRTGVFRMRMSRVPRCLLGVLCAWGLIAAAGCGGPKVYPVSGKATLDGKPFGGFVVTFTPDSAKGHQARVDCSARLGGDGQYSIRTDDGFKVYQGAPPGWYKVTLWSPEDKPIPVNKKYTDFKTTDLTIEVVADPAPGAYDLNFTK